MSFTGGFRKKGSQLGFTILAIKKYSFLFWFKKKTHFEMIQVSFL